MYNYIDNRVILEGEFIVKTKSTVRATANFFKLGKSTVHKDVTVRLKRLDKNLYEEVRKILETNLNGRHIRGGIATKKKFDEIKLVNEIIDKNKG